MNEILSNIVPLMTLFALRCLLPLVITGIGVMVLKRLHSAFLKGE